MFYILQIDHIVYDSANFNFEQKPRTYSSHMFHQFSLNRQNQKKINVQKLWIIITEFESDFVNVCLRNMKMHNLTEAVRLRIIQTSKFI